MASIDVTLRAGVVPVFPSTCVVCEEETEGALKIAQSSASPWLGFLFPLVMLTGWGRTTVPVCPECRWKFRWQRWGRWLALFVVGLGAAWLLMPYFKDWTPTVRKIVVGAGVFVVMFPVLMMHIYWPPYFDTMAGSEKVDYEFKSIYCAAQFHAANFDEVIASEVPDWLVRTFLGNGGAADDDDSDDEDEDDDDA